MPLRPDRREVGVFQIAIKMLLGDRAKYVGLIFGIAFTSFLVTFAASYFTGFMTRGFALIAENPAVDVWVMDPAVNSVEQTTNMPWSALDRVRAVEGVQSATPMILGTAEGRFPNGRFQSFQVIGIDNATLAGMPPLQAGTGSTVLRAPNAVAVADGGTSGKLETPLNEVDRWPHRARPLDTPTRTLQAGDDLLVNDHLARVAGMAQALPRFPPRPLMYATVNNAANILLPERRQLTFVLVTAAQGISPDDLAGRIEARTGLRARAADAFEKDTVTWFLDNSEDVGDIAAMLTLAISVGLGVTGVMLYMFTNENLQLYAVFSAMGATRKMLLSMIFVQAELCALIGTGLGLGLCGIASQLVKMADYPFRIMWFTPLLGGLMVVLVSLVAALFSARPVLKLQPVLVFAGR